MASPYSPPAPRTAAERETAIGFAAGLGAYTLWGIAPLYFAAVYFANPWEIVAHRGLWTVALMVVILAAMGRLHRVAAIVADRRRLALLALTSLLITLNWGLFVWSIQVGRLHEASLGYFINPLVNVALGMIFLSERLNRWQAIAVACAIVGVGIELVTLGTVPWVALCLAFSFGFYGLIRKVMPVEPLSGLLVETSIIAPALFGLLIWFGVAGTGHFGPSAWGGGGLWDSLLLMLAGAVTAAPLALFVAGAQRLPYAIMGLLQYIAPSLQFLIAVLLFQESFAPEMLVTFAFIWLGLAVFTWDLLRRQRPLKRRAERKRAGA
jgi:chloramphenicol-sensitive protein RarD